MKKLKFAFVADPLENFNPVNETTLFMMREAKRRGAEVYFCEPQDLYFASGQVRAQFLKLEIKSGKSFYKVLSKSHLSLDQFKAVFLRKDPPFDQAYLEHMQLLSLAEDKVRMMNRPSGVLSSGEKLFPLLYSQFGPETLISASHEQIHQFILKQKEGAILKPLGLSGGRQIYFQSKKDLRNLAVILDQMTEAGKRHIVVQAYLAAVKKGDKRILLYQGEVLGVFNRVPQKGSVRSNLHAGGSAKKATLTRLEKEMVEKMKPELLERGLDFVGLDVIGGKLTEVNVTSPMGIAELNRFGSKKIERIIFDDLFA